LFGGVADPFPYFDGILAPVTGPVAPFESDPSLVADAVTFVEPGTIGVDLCLPFVGSALPEVRLRVAVVRRPVALVGLALSCMGVFITFVCQALAFVGQAFADLRVDLALVGEAIVLRLRVGVAVAEVRPRVAVVRHPIALVGPGPS
jgi:hypothetical protein